MLNDLPASLAQGLQRPTGVLPELPRHQYLDGFTHQALYFTEGPLMLRPELGPSELLVLDGGLAQPDHAELFIREARKDFKTRHRIMD